MSDARRSSGSAGDRANDGGDATQGRPPAADRQDSVRVGWRLDVDVANQVEAAAARFFADNVNAMRDRHLMRSTNTFAEIIVRYGLSAITAADPEDVLDRMRPSRRW